MGRMDVRLCGESLQQRSGNFPYLFAVQFCAFNKKHSFNII